MYDVVAAAGAERKEDVGDELDPLADDCAGFLEDDRRLSSLLYRLAASASEELFPEKRIVVFHIHLPHQPGFYWCLSHLYKPASRRAAAARFANDGCLAWSASLARSHAL